VTSHEHDTALYTRIHVRANRQRQWALLRLGGFAVTLLAMAVTQMDWCQVQHVSAPKGCCTPAALTSRPGGIQTMDPGGLVVQVNTVTYVVVRSLNSLSCYELNLFKWTKRN